MLFDDADLDRHIKLLQRPTPKGCPGKEKAKMRGTIVFFSSERGFGYAKPDGPIDRRPFRR